MIHRFIHRRVVATAPSKFHVRSALLSAMLLGACAPSLSQNPPREPERSLPKSYGAAENVPPTSGPAEGTGQSKWDAFFKDPNLTGLIETALKNNQELNIQLQEIILAQTEVMARKGEYLPKLDAEAGAGIEKVGKYTSQGASDEAHGVRENLPNFGFGFAASWEVDIWKRLRNSAKAAAHRYLASIEGKNFMVTQLVAEVARAYYELIALDSQLDVLKRNIQIQQDALEVVQLEKQAGRVTQLAVQRFEAEVLKNKSRQYALEQKVIETENLLNFLVGRFPQPVARSSEGLEPVVPNVIKAGVPSQLLDSRPDIRQAEHELSAAKLDVKAAKARFYPALSIEAGVGYEAFNGRHLVTTPQSLAYNLAGNLTAPLLNRRAIKADYFAANARQLQAVYNYERTLLKAFTDVANQLAKIRNLDQSYQLESKQVDLLTRAIDVSNVLFQSARADYMEVLLTRRDALDSQMELIDTKLQQQQAMVGVYQALGGGWR